MDKKSASHPIVDKLLAENLAFQQFPVEPGNRTQRNQLSILAEPTSKGKVWSILKENIGKDLSKITMPVTFNEPITMLQKCAENVEYHEILRLANKTEDRFLRTGYVVAAFYILYSNTINRVSKPFNPMLGETYEYFEGDLRMIIEQVSHHPPISAFYAECDDFTIHG